MEVKYASGSREYGVQIKLTGDEVAIAIDAWLVAHSIYINGPRTVRVNGEFCQSGEVYVDPSSSLIVAGERWSGRGPD